MASSRLTSRMGAAPSSDRRRDISSTGVGPVNNGTRERSIIAPRMGNCGRASFLRRRRWSARARDLIRLDLRRVEASRAAEHLVDCLVEVGGWLALKAQRIDARHDERLEIRALQATRFHALYCFVHQFVELE